MPAEPTRSGAAALGHQTILPQRGGALQPNHKLERRLEYAAAVLCLLVQAAVWVASAPHLTPTQHARQAALCTLWAAGGLLDALLPEKLWLRYRVVLITTVRVAAAIIPSHRSTSEGQAILLHAPATPGLLGALRDYVRVGFGTRVLLTSLVGVLLHQPPTVVLLQQVAVMWLSRADYCSCSLFRDPVSRARIGVVWDVLEVASIWVQPWGLAHIGLRQPALLQCTAVLTFHTILVGVLAPMLLAVFVEHLSPWTTGPAATSEHAQHPRQRPAASVTSDHCGQFSPAASIQHWCQRLDAALKSSRVHLARHPVVACLVAWVALGNLWLASVALAHLQLIS